MLMILTFRGKTGWREVEIGRGSSDQTCPVHALEQYLHYSRIDFGPLFQRVTRDDRKVTGNRLSDKHVARLIEKTVRDAGIRSGGSSTGRAPETVLRPFPARWACQLQRQCR